MCGIVGYIGPKSVVPLIVEGLRRLEYRGYDSAGIAVAGNPAHPGQLDVRRAPGKLSNLEAVLKTDPLTGSYGIGHTRWATHGRPTEENAHPHRDGSGTLVVVHNGIVENYIALKNELVARGHTFVSQTDTEIIAHLIEDEFNKAAACALNLSFRPERSVAEKPASTPVRQEHRSQLRRSHPHPPTEPIPLEEAVRRAVKRLTGAFAIGVLSAREPDKLVAARSAHPPSSASATANTSSPPTSPASSTTPATSSSCKTATPPSSPRTASPSPTSTAAPLQRPPQRITWDPIQAEKAGYKHFMLKEINEQPRAVRDTTLGRISLDTGEVFLPDLQLTREDLQRAACMTIAACGTSWHSGLAGKFMIERLARLPVDVDYASEYRYRDPIPGALGLLITQSGETADTIAAQSEMISKGTPTLAICNVVGSAITRRAQGVITTNAGPEIGVASTKAFTAQLTALFTLALYLGQQRGTSPADKAATTPTSSPRSPARSKTSSAPSTTRPAPSPNPSPPPATSSSSAAASTTPSPLKAPSSSKKSATSTQKATPPAK